MCVCEGVRVWMKERECAHTSPQRRHAPQIWRTPAVTMCDRYAAKNTLIPLLHVPPFFHLHFHLLWILVWRRRFEHVLHQRLENVWAQTWAPLEWLYLAAPCVKQLPVAVVVTAPAENFFMETKNRWQIHEGHSMTFIFSTPKGGLKHSALALRALVECRHPYTHTHTHARTKRGGNEWKISHSKTEVLKFAIKKSFYDKISWIVVLIMPCSRTPPGITQWLIIRKSAEALQRKSIAKSWRRFREYHQLWGEPKEKNVWMQTIIPPSLSKVIHDDWYRILLFLTLLLCRMHTILYHFIQKMPILTGNFRVLMSSVEFS